MSVRTISQGPAEITDLLYEPGTIEFFTLGVSVRLSDRSEVTQNKINFVKIAPSGV